MSELTAPAAPVEELSAAFLEHYGLLPLAAEESAYRVATWVDEPDVQALDDLRFILGQELALVRFSEAEIRAAIHRVYVGDSVTAEGVIAGLTDEPAIARAAEVPLDDLVHLANEAPVVKLVNLLLLEALEARASDVHLEGYADSLRVRYRIDGVLQEAPSPPAHLAPAVVSRLKIMADLDIAERRVPQDGRIRLRLQDRHVDVRVATLPTLHGESLALRLLDKEEGWGRLEELGMAADTLEQFLHAITRPHGIVLATGPTGSGKTTTLYAAIERIRTGREKILTVEDPVEYELPGVPQVPVNEKLGVTFAAALRALLRQDPDVVLVGEIRDEETAQVATHAALTGHLVLSTLHTNDAIGAITRLQDLGVPPFLVASTVQAVVAQRLVRQVCRECGAWVSTSERPIYRGAGCPACWNTGYRGRSGIYEALVLDEDLRAGIAGKQAPGDLRKTAIDHGMRTLLLDGERTIREGITTPEEVLRVCGS